MDADDQDGRPLSARQLRPTLGAHHEKPFLRPTYLTACNDGGATPGPKASPPGGWWPPQWSVPGRRSHARQPQDQPAGGSLVDVRVARLRPGRRARGLAPMAGRSRRRGRRGVVLEVGCGPAFLARSLRSRGVNYVGLDRNPAMLRQGRRATHGWASGRSRLVRGDLTALPFRTGSFDVVVAAGVLGLLRPPQRRAALRELARVSRGEVRLLEPIARGAAGTHRLRTRLLAFATSDRAGRAHGRRAPTGAGRTGAVGRRLLTGPGDAAQEDSLTGEPGQRMVRTSLPRARRCSTSSSAAAVCSIG